MASYSVTKRGAGTARAQVHKPATNDERGSKANSREPAAGEKHTATGNRRQGKEEHPKERRTAANGGVRP